MSQAPVAILIPSYKRASIVRRTIEHLHGSLAYAGDWEIRVSEDGDRDDLLALHHAVEDFPKVKIFEGPHGGLGANLNFLILEAMKDGFELFMQMDDDHWLIKPIDLTPHVERLESDLRSGWIRLMGVGAHKLRADLEGLYWRISWDSDELYIASNRPHLKHARFHRWFGLYPEFLKLGQTEESFCHICVDRARSTPGALSVLVPLDVPTESGWDHVGDSWQLKGL